MPLWYLHRNLTSFSFAKIQIVKHVTTSHNIYMESDIKYLIWLVPYPQVS